jgi:RNA polymerase sigma-70 factor (ECF subfamily)
MSTAVVMRGPQAALDPESDEEVIAAVRGGDAARFEVIMRRHNQRLFRTARAILRDDAEAEDAVQQAYLSAYGKLDQFRGEARFSTWLTRITVHECLRRTRKHARLTDLSVIEGGEEPLAVAPRNPEEEASGAEMRILLESAIDSLPEAYRVVFVMRDVEEFSTRECADVLDMSEEAVRVRLHRARKALRDWLEERADTAAADAFHFAGERCQRIVLGVLTTILA